MNIVKPNFDTRFQRDKTAVNFKFKAENWQLSCNKDMWIKYIALLFEKFIS